MKKEKIITYSLLAQIRNTGNFIDSPLEIFVPLIKRALYKLNMKRILSGNSISIIKEEADNLYGIDFPIPVLKYILNEIKKEVEVKNGKATFSLFNDGSFIIDNYLFDDYEDKIQKSLSNIIILEDSFKKFCEINKINKEDYASIFDFIDQNKLEISRYLNFTRIERLSDYTIEALFVDYFRDIPEIFSQIRDIYLGSILSTYLTFQPEKVKTNVELLFDTNFILGLLDLNTPESTHTCAKLIEIGKLYGYKFSILEDTVEEITRLINKKSEMFDTAFISKKVNPEDLYNACERRNLKPFDLLHIVNNLERSLNKYGIGIVKEVTKYRNNAKFSKIFGVLKKIRNTEFAAMHDAIAHEYVREKRGSYVKEFDRVNCWFVNNTTRHDTPSIDRLNNLSFQPEAISADELISILWLSNPSIVSSSTEISDIGLSALISVTLNESLPKASIIRELDENIFKYKDDDISDLDVVRVSQRIFSRKMQKIDELNEMAKQDRKKFIETLKEEAKKQEEAEKNKLEELNSYVLSLKERISDLGDQIERVKSERKGIVNRENDFMESSKEQERRNIKLQNELRKYKREAFYEIQIKKWRLKTWLFLLSVLSVMSISLVLILYISSWNLSIALTKYAELQGSIIWITMVPFIGTMVSAYLVNSLVLKYENHSNIEAFKRGLVVPDDYKDID
ncbi:hypothetical protein [Leptospira kmetyi]|uniref:Uncharacterized protein n=1 Tax=Leptospira kmetyi TaxID=408139 RepID=A0ABX4N8G8_9LEPT|nr:hypothetical protein [Leptospira kmetyi]PJZ29636.1 hypothetical protein CH378_11840 [Leptospira kmetyi]